MKISLRRILLLTGIGVIILFGGIFYFYRMSCIVTNQIALSDSIQVTAKSYLEKPAGECVSRSIDVYVNGKRIRRMWCSPMPTDTDGTGYEIALCKGQKSEYVVISDMYAVWILEIKDPAKLIPHFQNGSRQLSSVSLASVISIQHTRLAYQKSFLIGLSS